MLLHLSVSHEGTPLSTDCHCPECSTPWDDEVAQAAAWLDAGAQLEGLCSCGAYLVWERRSSGGWGLEAWVGPPSTTS
jgi:hypothetical protein